MPTLAQHHAQAQLPNDHCPDKSRPVAASPLYSRLPHCWPWARFPTGLQPPPHPASRLHGLIGGGVQVGFPRRDPVALQDALARTHKVLWIRNTKQTRWARKGQLIGFARATSDGVCAATIWDVAVRLPGHPGWPCTSHGLLSPGMGPQLDESLCVGPEVFWGETALLMRVLLDL